jgi:hypothetical protein
MELTTILNRCHPFRGFVYERARFSSDKRSIEVVLRPRKGSAAVCSRCHLPAPRVRDGDWTLRCQRFDGNERQNP